MRRLCECCEYRVAVCRVLVPSDGDHVFLCELCFEDAVSYGYVQKEVA